MVFMCSHLINLIIPTWFDGRNAAVLDCVIDIPTSPPADCLKIKNNQSKDILDIFCEYTHTHTHTHMLVFVVYGDSP